MSIPRKYKSFADVKTGDVVYIAWFVGRDDGGREPYAPKLVVHGTDMLGNVAVRDALHPDRTWYDGGHEWMPSWLALYATREDAIAALERAASRGEV